MKLDTKAYEEKMKKSISAYQTELESVRVGRANANVLNKITVEYYGTPTQISAVAQITTPDARTLAIQPWDATTLKAIEKAILASDIGITPANDGTTIRLVFPQLTEERRRELCKQVTKMGEDAKVAVRNIRRDANDMIKRMQKDGEMTEDEAKSSEKSVQDLTDRNIKQIDAAVARKQSEVMAI